MENNNIILYNKGCAGRFFCMSSREEKAYENIRRTNNIPENKAINKIFDTVSTDK